MYNFRLFKDYPPQKTAGILINFSKEVCETRKLINDDVTKERRKKEKMKTLNSSVSLPASSSPGLDDKKKVGRRGMSTDSGNGSTNETDLESILDAVANNHITKGKRRRSRKHEVFDNFNSLPSELNI